MLNRLKQLFDGFTLVETLVSLVILSLGLIPTLAVITSSVNISKIIRNNLIGAQLNQEGLEVVRSLRDANWFNGSGFNNNLVGTWRIEWNTDWTTNPPVATNPLTNPLLKFDQTTGLYSYSIGQDTFFKRLITISMIANTCNCEMLVRSEVAWTDFRRTRTIMAESHLFDWR